LGVLFPQDLVVKHKKTAPKLGRMFFRGTTLIGLNCQARLNQSLTGQAQASSALCLGVGTKEKASLKASHHIAFSLFCRFSVHIPVINNYKIIISNYITLA
jgi:hypothetical protein